MSRRLGHLARRARIVVLAACLVTGLVAVPSHGDDRTQLLRGLTTPVGFGASVFATADGLPTAITIGPDGRIYATLISADFSSGWIMAWEDVGGIGGPGEVVVSDLSFPMGLVFDEDGNLYVSENANFDGPGAHGWVTALHDSNDDGTLDTRRTVLSNIPNGRHQLNGLTMGPDGWVYIANGNATDNGVDCGPPLFPGGSIECTTPETKPWSGAILKAHPEWEDVDLLDDVAMDAAAFDDPDVIGYQEVLVAEGFRNIFGLAFRPEEPTSLYTVMNGSDNPSSSEPIYRTDVADEVVVGTNPDGTPATRPVIDNMGFPSCLYDPHENPFPMPSVGDHDHPGDFTPRDNPNPRVIEKFGRCPVNQVTVPIGFAAGHSGSTGLAFVPEGNFPERYHGDLIYGEWGSLWNLNGAYVTGHKVVHVEVNDDGTLGRKREFMTTPLPMDIVFDADGVMFVADMAGAIYRVEHLMDTPDTVTIRMVQGQFVPQVVTVPRRTTIEWVNDDTVARNVVGQRSVHAEQPLLRPGSEVNSAPAVAPGQKHVYTTGDLAGAWHYASSTAPAMQGVLVVAPADR